MPTFSNYSGSLQSGPNGTYEPVSLAALQQIVLDCAQKKKHITTRAGGNFLHNQALPRTGAPNDVVVLLHHMPHSVCVTIDDLIVPQGHDPELRWHTVETSAWTPWEVILRATLRIDAPHGWSNGNGNGNGNRPTWCKPTDDPREVSAHDGTHCHWCHPPGHDRGALPRLVPYCLVSSGRISPGGSISADAVWRYSSALARESTSLVWLDLLRADGTIVRLFNSRWGFWDARHVHAPQGTVVAPTKQENDDWFDCAVGGYGLVGMIVRAKYLLVELDPELTPNDFRLAPPTHLQNKRHHRGWLGPREPSAPRAPGAPRRKRGWLDGRRVRRLRKRARELWPVPPHAGVDDLGVAGDELDLYSLSWMWPTRDASALFDTIVPHYRSQQQIANGRAGLPLPRRIDPDTVACFGVLFANACRAGRGLIANITYGRRGKCSTKFSIWDRHSNWQFSRFILRSKLLPCFARLGEWITRAVVFGPAILRSPTANTIPEFVFFFEGHTMALEELRDKPETLQQSFIIPIDTPAGAPDDANARVLFLAFMSRLSEISRRPLSHRRAARITVCDVKCIPPSRTKLSSAPVASLMITVSVENPLGYDRLPGTKQGPANAISELAAEFAPRVRVHLSKNLHIPDNELQAMYDPQIQRFKAVRQIMDPNNLWQSQLRVLLNL